MLICKITWAPHGLFLKIQLTKILGLTRMLLDDKTYFPDVKAGLKNDKKNELKSLRLRFPQHDIHPYVCIKGRYNMISLFLI